MENNLTYTKNGDYLDPRPEAGGNETPGPVRRMRRDYLKEHRPVLFNAMMVSGKLYPHLNEIEQTMNRRLEQMMPELMQAAGVTEELKARDPMTWVADEQLQSPGGGNSSDGTYIQLTLFPSEQEQIRRIDEGPGVFASGLLLSRSRNRPRQHRRPLAGCLPRPTLMPPSRNGTAISRASTRLSAT